MTKLKWKNSITPTNFVFSLSPSLLPWRFFKKFIPILPIFGSLPPHPPHPSFQKRRGTINLKNPKNLWNNICLFLCVPVGAFWCFLNVFTAVFTAIWFFLKTFSHFYDRIKHKAGNSSILPHRVRTPWKLFKPKIPKDLLSF